MLYLRPVLVLGLTMLALSQILGWLRSRYLNLFYVVTLFCLWMVDG